MIELHDVKGTKSFGCFKNFKSCKSTLQQLKERGELRESRDTVTVCSFKNAVLQRAYNVRFLRDKWRPLPLPPTPAA